MATKDEKHSKADRPDHAKIRRKSEFTAVATTNKKRLMKKQVSVDTYSKVSSTATATVAAAERSKERSRSSVVTTTNTRHSPTRSQAPSKAVVHRPADTHAKPPIQGTTKKSINQKPRTTKPNKVEPEQKSFDQDAPKEVDNTIATVVSEMVEDLTLAQVPSEDETPS